MMTLMTSSILSRMLSTRTMRCSTSLLACTAWVGRGGHHTGPDVQMLPP